MLRFSVLGSLLALCAACSGPDDPPIEPTYDNIENLVRESCAFTVSCHGGLGRGKARLNFATLLDEGIPITTVLNDVPSCEYNVMPRVDPGNPDNSWLMIKIAGAHTGARLDFTADPSWDPMVMRNSDGTYRASTCPLTIEGELSFGEIMPMGGQLSPNRLKAFREWIEMGAPGPEDYDAGQDAGVPEFVDMGGSEDATMILDGASDAAMTLDAASDAMMSLDAASDAMMSLDASTDATSSEDASIDAASVEDASTADASAEDAA